MGKPQTFRSPTAVVVWVVWLLFAIGNWIDLAVQGRDHASAVAAAILLLATGAAYVTAQRPRLIVDDAGLTIRNPLRDYRTGWAGVAKVDLIDLLRVHCDKGPAGGEPHRKVVSVWAVHYSRRRQLTAEARARRPARPRRSSVGWPAGDHDPSYGAPVSAPDTPTAEREAEKIFRLVSERATAARAEAVWAVGTAEAAGTRTPAETGTRTAAEAGAAGGTTAVDVPGWAEPLRSTWSGLAIAALVIPALILLVVWLL